MSGGTQVVSSLFDIISLRIYDWGMAASTFNDPEIVLDRIYTRGGDSGRTMLVNGRRVRKDDDRVEAYGTVDELNACIGRARERALRDSAVHPDLAGLCDSLLRVQHELFNLGSEVATDPEMVRERQPRILGLHVDRLEQEIDDLTARLEPLQSFVLPGGSPLNADLHVCRTVCRRAERRVAALAEERASSRQPGRYLNRLSDALFVWGRWACRCTGQTETPWHPHPSK